MSETIDPTNDDADAGRRSEQTSHQEGQRQRQRTESRPSSVYVVIHDKEPDDSGSDYNYSAHLPDRQDTTIVGIFYEYHSAARAAGEYVRDELCQGDEEEDDEGDDDDAESHAPFSYIDWRGEGWYQEECYESGGTHDRIHIQVHQVR